MLSTGSVADWPSESQRRRKEFLAFFTAGALSRGIRLPLVIAVHAALIVAANYLACWLRFDGNIPQVTVEAFIQTLPWLVLIRGLLFVPFGLYGGLWRYTSIWDLSRIVAAVLTSSVPLYLLVYQTLGPARFPRSIVIVDSLLLISFLGGVRLLRRVIQSAVRARDGRRVLIVGAGDAGDMIVREMRRGGGYQPIAFIDDDPAKVGRTIHGVTVLGTRDDLPAYRESHEAPGGPCRNAERRRRRPFAASSSGSRRSSCRSPRCPASTSWSMARSASSRSALWLSRICCRASRSRSNTEDVRTLSQGQARPRDGRWRVDRFGTVPSDRSARTGEPDPLRALREQPVRDHQRSRRPDAGATGPSNDRRRHRCQPCRSDLRGASSAPRVPCGRSQARSPDGGESLRSRQEQRAGHADRCRSCAAARGGAFRTDFHRQGGQSVERHGRDQAGGRADRAGHRATGIAERRASSPSGSATSSAATAASSPG